MNLKIPSLFILNEENYFMRHKKGIIIVICMLFTLLPATVSASPEEQGAGEGITEAFLVS